MSTRTEHERAGSARPLGPNSISGDLAWVIVERQPVDHVASQAFRLRAFVISAPQGLSEHCRQCPPYGSLMSRYRSPSVLPEIFHDYATACDQSEGWGSVLGDVWTMPCTARQ
jgi:hypothetical protein